MIFLAGSAASGKTKKAVAYGWKERKTSEDGVLLFSLQHEKKEMWKILQSMYGQEELSKIEIDDTPAMMVERMAEIIAQKAENGAISVFVIDEVPMMTSRKKFCRQKRRAAVYDWLAGKLREKRTCCDCSCYSSVEILYRNAEEKRSKYLLWRNRKTRKLSGFRIDKNLSTYGIRQVVR